MPFCLENISFVTFKVVEVRIDSICILFNQMPCLLFFNTDIIYSVTYFLWNLAPYYLYETSLIELVGIRKQRINCLSFLMLWMKCSLSKKFWIISCRRRFHAVKPGWEIEIQNVAVKEKHNFKFKEDHSKWDLDCLFEQHCFTHKL